MHQLIDKKYKIIIYVIFLFILSTTSGKYIENKNYFSENNKIKVDVEGLSNSKNSEISDELDNILSLSLIHISEPTRLLSIEICGLCS